MLGPLEKSLGAPTDGCHHILQMPPSGTPSLIEFHETQQLPEVLQPMMQLTVEQLTVQEEPIINHSMVTRSQTGVPKPNPKCLYSVEKITIETKSTNQQCNI